jgi:hypothetical protein
MGNGNFHFLNSQTGSAGSTISWTTLMKLDNSGNVGIGTSSPQLKLDIQNGSLAVYQNTANSNGAQLYLGDMNFPGGAYATSAPGIGAVYNASSGVSSDLAFYVYTGNMNSRTERMRIGSDGRVFIGVAGSSNGHKLEINAGSTSAVRIDVTSGTSGISMSPGALFGIDKPGVGGGTFRITSGGNVGINQNNPQAAFQINGRGGADIIFQMNDETDTRRCFFIPNQYYGYMWAVGVVSNGGKAFSLGNASGTEVGTIVINAGGVAYNTTSDYRLKEDLKDFNGLEKVSAIKVYDFKWKNLNERVDGVLAHELAEVLPYAVSGIKDALNHEGNIEAQSVDYSKLTPVLIKAIQELKATNDDLQSQINELKAQ